MTWLPDAPAITSATFKVLDGAGAGGTPFDVQFNPASLEYTVSNDFDDRNGNNGARQFVKKNSAKLTMTLAFDTTDVGTSVRDVTANLAALLQPTMDGSKKVAPKVEFGWGTYSFKGVAEQFKETIDFFSADGVPLRSSVALTLSQQTAEFQSNKSPAPAVDRSAQPDPVSAPAGASPADLSNALGDPRAARAIASANGASSLRFGGDVAFGVGGDVTLSAAAAFSVGASANVGLGASAGIGIGIGASAGVGASVGIGAGLSVGATAGASFGGLRVALPTVGVNVADARAALLPAPRLAGAASFGAGGRATVQAGASLAADVGATADLHTRIDFGA